MYRDSCNLPGRSCFMTSSSQGFVLIWKVWHLWCCRTFFLVCFLHYFINNFPLVTSLSELRKKKYSDWYIWNTNWDICSCINYQSSINCVDKQIMMKFHSFLMNFSSFLKICFNFILPISPHVIISICMTRECPLSFSQQHPYCCQNVAS